MSFREQADLLTAIYNCEVVESRSFLIGLGNGLLLTAMMASVAYWAAHWWAAF